MPWVMDRWADDLSTAMVELVPQHRSWIINLALTTPKPEFVEALAPGAFAAN
jgi:hypothetical protein